jgi:ribosome-associated protein
MVLTFDLANSGALDEKEKARLLKKLRPRLSGDEILMLSSDSSRRQSQNKDLVTRRFYEIIKEALKVPKKRKRTTPTKAAVEKRLTAKKKVAEKKITRKKPPPGL